ncbi:hypothetical protein QBC41DRAFT_331544 [Cercophora samala]|uniref:Uncharacterized protein n=1 Tax=Cercophora samala TaxID=330535 RepID=A0AA39YVR0_9PEZI|nr:hypothetical protein QBC41DRAFT_331544 [Cercophora samala]
MLARQPSPSQDLLDWVNPEDEQDQFGIEDEAVNWCYVVFGMPAQDPPPSLTSQWFSYQSAQASYASSVAPAVSSLKAKCNRDIAPAFDMLVATDIESCHTAVKAAHSVLSGVDTTTTASPSPSRTVVLAPSTTIGPREETSASEKDTESKEGSAQSTGTSAAVGARETGYVAVAAAAAVAAIAGGMVVV